MPPVSDISRKHPIIQAKPTMAYSKSAPSTQAGNDTRAQSSILFKHNPLSIWILDLETLKFLAVNRIAVQQYGFSQNQFLTMTLRDIVPNDRIAEILNHIKSTPKAVTRASILKCDKTYGDLMEVELLCNEFIYEKRAALLVLTKEITENKNTYASSSSGRQMYLKPIAHSTDIISRVDRRLRVQNDNREIDQMTGMNWSELLGKPYTGLEISEDAVRKSQIYSNGSAFDLQQLLPPDGEGYARAAIGIPTRAWFPSWRRLILSLRIRSLAIITKSFAHKSWKFGRNDNIAMNDADMDGSDAIDIRERHWYPGWMTMFQSVHHPDNIKQLRQRAQPSKYRSAYRVSPRSDGGGI